MGDRTCKICDQVFRYPSDLKSHLRRKTSCAPIAEPAELSAAEMLKPHPCRYCMRRFATQISMLRHVRQSCKIANSEGGMDKLLDHTLRQMRAENHAQNAKIDKLTELMERLSDAAAVAPAMQHTTINATIININPWDGGSRISLSTEQMAAAILENSRCREYAQLGDHDMTNLEIASPYISDLFMELTKRAHATPETRNIYLNPKRADQVLVHMTAGHWEVLTLTDATQEIFDGLAGRIHRVILTDAERQKLPLEAQNALSYAELLYREEPAEYVRAARAPMMAHLSNTAPA